MSQTKAEAARLLTKAAEHIETVGLNQDGDYYSKADTISGVPVPQARCCALASIALVGDGLVGGGTEWLPGASYHARRELGELVETEHGGLPVPRWNDHPSTTQADVTDTMRRAAKKLEEQA